jgi:hypothetical protein
VVLAWSVMMPARQRLLVEVFVVIRNRYLSLSLSVIPLLIACVPPGADEIDDDEVAENDREYIIGGSPATSYPEAALVNMLSGGQIGSICSGAVIAPRVVLTAGHCVTGGWSGWQIIAPFSTHGQQGFKASSGATQYVSYGNSVNPNTADVGLVFTDKPMHLTSYPVVSKTSVADGSLLQNIGRINNGQASYSALFLGPQIAVKDGSWYGFPLSYTSTQKIQPGDSGGLVVGAGSHTIFAVNSGVGGGTQILARVDLVYNWINQQVMAHGGWGPNSGNPPPPNDPPADPSDPPADDPSDPPADDPSDPPADDPSDPPGGGSQDGSAPEGIPGGSGCYGFVEICDDNMYIWCTGGSNGSLHGKHCASCTETDPGYEAVASGCQ